jgi:acetoin utilization deacetylase AcuC-like enzyme
MLCSTFQHPFYPYLGSDSVNEHIINVPLPAGTGSEAFRAAVSENWLPALARFKPEMLFISAGFDAHRDDDMAGFNLLEADYAWVTRQLMDVAATFCGKRVVSVLEGGYHLSALGRSALAHLKALNGSA